VAQADPICRLRPEQYDTSFPRFKKRLDEAFLQDLAAFNGADETAKDPMRCCPRHAPRGSKRRRSQSRAGMIRMVEMDDAVPIRNQFGDTSDLPVLLVNILHVPPAEIDALLAAWIDDADFFKAQPGFISAQLHRGIGGSAGRS